MVSILLHALAGAVYAVLAAYFWKSRWLRAPAIAESRYSAAPAPAPGFRLWERGVLTGAVAFHAVLLANDMFGGAQFHFGFAHALSIMTLLAWLIFGGLLLGRAAYGWRGRVALKGTFAGFAALLLAYVGSRFVLEVILNRV